MDNAFRYVDEFEKQIASYTGAKYGIATDCCTHALFLSLYYYKQHHRLASVVILSTGRGGMILTDDDQFYKWAQRAVHDGRDMSIPYEKDNITFAGWHYFMTPETAQIGLEKLRSLPDYNKDCASSQTYPDISYTREFI